MRTCFWWPLALLLAGWLAFLPMAPATAQGHSVVRPLNAAAASSPLPAGQSLNGALTPAGTLRPGVTGSFNASGYRLGTDPTSGQPTFQPARTTGAGDENWQDGFGLPGTNANVYAVVVTRSGEMYIGGSFTIVGTVVANRVAHWDGTAWSAMGTGLDDDVYTLDVSGTDVYVGGIFTHASGAPANYVAKWDGTTWSALDVGLNDKVYSLAVSGTNLYVGGLFTTAGGIPASYVAKWDGTAWSALGLGLDNSVYTLAVSSTNVYVGGAFTQAGGAAANRVAKWNGTAWSALGTGLNNYVSKLGVVGTTVYVGGAFTQAGGAAASKIAKWNGTAWSTLGTGVNNDVHALTVFGTHVYVSGAFTQAGGVAVGYIAHWNGTAWSALGTGLSTSASALAVSGTNLYVGGTFNTAGGVVASHIAKWSGTTWSALSPGLNSNVRAVAVLGTDVYVGGTFTTAGGVVANHIAKWDGTAWSALGTGLNNDVWALAVAGTDVYVGGTFTQAGGAPANWVAKWDGTAWSALGTGINSGPNPFANNGVSALAVAFTGVYAGGFFTQAGGVAANNVAYWDGTAWSALGSGVNGPVSALAIAGTTVYVGGDFTQAGGVSANFVARWKGRAWSALGTGLNNGVSALAVSGPALYVGGFFTQAGGASANHIAKWDGTAWSTLGTGVNSNSDNSNIHNIGNVTTLTMHGPDVCAGGVFVLAGGVPAANIAKWNGTAWSALGTGLNNYVDKLAIGPGSMLYAGGWFTTVGDGSKVTAYFGRYLLNDVPTTLALAPQSVTENVAAGTVVGTFATTDPDVGDTFTYTLVGGVGSTDNGTFGINGNQLLITASPDYEAQPSYTIRVRTTDQGSLFTEQTFTVTVLDVIEDLVVSTGGQTIGTSTYHDVTITGTGAAQLTGTLTVTGTLLVQAGGTFRDGCQLITGPGAFTLAAGAQLTICSAQGISINGPTGTVQVAGLRTFSPGAYYHYASSSAQITGTGLPARTLALFDDSDHPLLLSQPVAVRSAVVLTGTGHLFINGQMLTLLSNADTTACVGNSGGGTGTVVGTATVQRYISAATNAGLGYHHLSSPMIAATIADLATPGFTPRVNAAYNVLPTPPQTSATIPNVFAFDESRGGLAIAFQGFNFGYYSPVSLGDLLGTGYGYTVAITGGLTPDLVGTLQTGPIGPLSLTCSTTNTSPNNQKAGWQLLGNPYPQPISWDYIPSTAFQPGGVYNGLGGAISVFKSTGLNSGQYLTRVGGIGTLPNGLLALGQGFFVRVTNPGSVNFTFTDALRTFANPAHYRPAIDPRPQVRLTLQQTGAPNAVPDAALVYFDAAATTGFDAALDGPRPGRNLGTVPTLATLTDTDEELAVNALPTTALTTGAPVPLLLTLPTAGTWTLSASELANLAGTTVALVDRLTNTTYDLAATPTVTFTAAQVGEVRGRFALLMGQRALGVRVEAAAATLQLVPNPARNLVRLAGATGTAATLLDATGRVVRTWVVPAGTAELSLTGLAPGVYAVRCGREIQRLVVE